MSNALPIQITRRALTRESNFIVRGRADGPRILILVVEPGRDYDFIAELNEPGRIIEQAEQETDHDVTHDELEAMVIAALFRHAPSGAVGFYEVYAPEHAAMWLYTRELPAALNSEWERIDWIDDADAGVAMDRLVEVHRQRAELLGELSSLSFRERDLLLEVDASYTMEQIGQALGVSRQRAHQLVQAARRANSERRALDA